MKKVRPGRNVHKVTQLASSRAESQTWSSPSKSIILATLPQGFLSDSSTSHTMNSGLASLYQQKNNKTFAHMGFPGGAVVKNPSANAGDMGSSPGPGRSHMLRSN